LEKIAKSKDGPDVGVSADVEFHRCIAKISKNTQMFLRFLETYLVEAICLARQNSAKHRGLTELVQKEHQAIFEAIADGDPGVAHAAIRNHLRI
jgi:GntR family transcriptional repressor for pyruvate dehydrogenase complex